MKKEAVSGKVGKWGSETPPAEAPIQLSKLDLLTFAWLVSAVTSIFWQLLTNTRSAWLPLAYFGIWVIMLPFRIRAERTDGDEASPAPTHPLTHSPPPTKPTNHEVAS